MVVSPAQLSDESLAAAAAAGDDHAFEILVERYQARVYRLACRMTSDTEAPDILQDTFLQVHKHLRGLPWRRAGRHVDLPDRHQRVPYAQARSGPAARGIIGRLRADLRRTRQA